MKKKSCILLLVSLFLSLLCAGFFFSCAKVAVHSESDDVVLQEIMEAVETAEDIDEDDTAEQAVVSYYAVREERAEGYVESKKAKKKTKSIKTWKRSQVEANTSKLMIGDNEELPLKGLQVNVLIDGFRARVIMDAFYFNDRGRQFEGTFKLKLPEGANPYFFAFGEMTMTSEVNFQKPIFISKQNAEQLGTTPDEIMAARNDSWTAPKEARMVPKEKAAHAYGETVRRRVDPALMEWAGAGIFSSRVFPLMPDKLHRIVIGYEVDLLSVGQDFKYQINLPSDIPQSVVNISVTKIPEMQTIVSPKKKQSSVTTDSGTTRSFYSFENPKENNIQVLLKNMGNLLLSGTDKKTGKYFTSAFYPELPAITQSAGSDTGVFLIDVSLSSNPDQFNIYLKLLKAVLNNNRDTLKKFAVVFFNIETFWWQNKFVTNNTENVSELLKYSNQLSLEGATDLGAALAQASSPGWLTNEDNNKQWDLFLLSDGAATWGNSNLFSLSQLLSSGHTGSLYAYRTGFSGTDKRMLNHLTRESGGALFSVVSEAEIETVSKAHRFIPWQIDSIKMKGCSDLLIAGRPVSIYPEQILWIAGRGAPDNKARVILTLRQGEMVKKVEALMNHVIASPLAARSYGLIAVGQLEAFGYATQEISKAYSTHFRVTGKTTSLLMLESEDDYKRFNIKPEENAFVINATPVAKYLSDIIKKIGKSLGNPKVAFLAWLKKMETQPGFTFEVPTAYKLAINKIPENAFQVYTQPLESGLRTWNGVPEVVKKQLSTKKIEYDVISKEAGRRLKAYGPSDALRSLSSLIENSPGDSVLARDIAYSATNWSLPGHAFHLFNRVADSRPYEPQTYRAMARVLEDIGRVDLSMLYYEVGLIGQWNRRFGEFRSILGYDYLRFLRKIDSGKLQTYVPEYAKARLESVAKEFDPGKVDLLISITWNTDGTDVDLHVTEPTGEICFYSHPNTKIGGHITRDVTQGYGPEMYTLPNAKAGKYRIRVKYFASNINRASTQTKVSATVIEGWGTDDEKITRKTVTLRKGKEMHDMMTIKL